jgi:hypothetical protein
MKSLITFTIIIFCAYWIFKFLIELMYKSKAQESEVKEQITTEASLNTFVNSEPLRFVYFKIANSELEYYAYCLDTDVLIHSRNISIMYGNITYERIETMHFGLRAIVRQFINERNNGFNQYEEVSEADFLHVFTEVANLSAKSFEPILNNQFHA